MAALGPILGAAMEQQHLPILKLKSLEMEDISQYFKDHEAYVAVGGKRRLAEFLGGSSSKFSKMQLRQREKWPAWPNFAIP